MAIYHLSMKPVPRAGGRLATAAAAQGDINWARDRQALWNTAERAEKRKNLGMRTSAIGQFESFDNLSCSP